MERGEFGTHTGPSYGAVGQSAGFHRQGLHVDHQEEFQQMSDSVSSNIFQINSNTAALERILKQISSGKERVPQEKIHRIQQGTNKLASTTTHILKNMTSLCGPARQNRIQHERLKDDFREAVSRYYSVQNKIADQEKLLVNLSSKQDQSHHGDFGSDQTQLIEDDRRRNEQEQLSEQIAVDEAIVYEREDRIRQIEADILDINEIFRDLASMVHEQGEMIDSIEGNIDRVHTNVESANTQLYKASQYQKASRKKICCLLVIVVLAAGAVGLILYFSLKK
ncbi:syntaxin-7 isoform X2 [Exaiptasia diaphana]|uniref:t-SNARE coiled-coil homology domain-containing protein n=1 Tax=Exaiptasia diaphana TaxID=2652724 RepID=A0A913XBT6_EXADI|nr:syntaxin-7 isoform X2 [Exaiptasia diaphana]